tara:strand:- start:10616 stop:11878 length:1263 start_codon:yes stop_codon:yes gene_type:complete
MNKIGIIGLGYVGLPLAVEFSKKYNTIGFDIDLSRINDLQDGIDKTLECSRDEIISRRDLKFTSNEQDLCDVNVYIVTVPTPVDSHNQPDLTSLEKASQMVAKYLSKDDLVIYESTVYPGATEEVCVPILEDISGLKLNNGFYVGYSPERINPGDKVHTLTKIRKVTSGSNKDSSIRVDKLYKSIISAGTYSASSIKVAEAAKVIENTQRDINIALVNELAIIFNKLKIDTSEVLEAAGTKWNFLPFVPGLVGGHCIGVDPYYLTHKAQSINYQPEVILAGRRLNDGMGRYVASSLIREMLKKDITVNRSSVLVMGFTFKENCPDIRNTRVIDIVNELSEYNISVDVYDPLCRAEEVKEHYNLDIIRNVNDAKYDGVILAVPHAAFVCDGATHIRRFCKKNSIIYDLKSALSKDESDLRL